MDPTLPTLLRQREELYNQIQSDTQSNHLKRKLIQLDAQIDQIEAKSHPIAKESPPEIAPSITQLAALFAEGERILEAGKKRSLFSKLFGRHPKVLLSYQISKIDRFIQEDKQKITLLDFSKQSDLKKLQMQLEELYSEASHQIHKRWNPSLYSETFGELAAKSYTLKKQLQKLPSLKRG